SLSSQTGQLSSGLWPHIGVLEYGLKVEARATIGLILQFRGMGNNSQICVFYLLIGGFRKNLKKCQKRDRTLSHGTEDEKPFHGYGQVTQRTALCGPND